MTLLKENMLMIMAHRFYQAHSHTGDGKFWNFVKGLDLFGFNIVIHAEVDLGQAQIELRCVDLKYAIQITTGRFAFDHAKFEDYEAIITHYAYHCLSNPPIFGE